MYVTTNFHASSSFLLSLINIFFQGHLLKMISHEVLIVVAMKIIVLWGMMPYSSVHRAQHLGIIYFLHFLL